MSWHQTADHGASETSAVAGSHTDEEARSTSGPAADQLCQGQVVQARLRGVVHWAGTVDTVSVALGVVWIREKGLGERKLLDLREDQVHPTRAPTRNPGRSPPRQQGPPRAHGSAGAPPS